jgi:prolyl-tRNA synthetase
MAPLKKVSTPQQRTIEDIVTFLNIPAVKQVKTLIYEADGELVAVILRGDRELNEIKLKNLLNCNDLDMAGEEKVRDKCAAGFGSLGPVNLPLKIYADFEIKGMRNFSCGANEDDYHFNNVNLERDFAVYKYADLRNAVAGDKCPNCQHSLKTIRGIEVGHIFKLGTKYSEALEATYSDQNGQNKYMVMGCYGIGVSRTMASAVEQNNDENGIIWPLPIAPYQVIIIPVNAKKADQLDAANDLYEQLLAQGVEVILDDRDERAGVKFKDADLIGIPLRVTIGPKSLAENKFELKKRWESESQLIDIETAVACIKEIINQNS